VQSADLFGRSGPAKKGAIPTQTGPFSLILVGQWRSNASPGDADGRPAPAAKSAPPLPAPRSCPEPRLAAIGRGSSVILPGCGASTVAATAKEVLPA